MTKPTTAVATKPAVNEERGLTSYVPFGSKQEVKLNIEMVKRFIAVPTRSGLKPTDDDCIKFIALCKARLLNPYEGDAYMIGFDSKDGPKFNLITAHQAFLKRAEINSEYDGMKSGILVMEDEELKQLEGDFHTDDQIVVGGWAEVFFKNRRNSMSKRVRLKRFQKSFGVWQDDPAGMICKCAEADALRSSFPTMLGGLYLKEEMKDEAPTVSAPIFSTTPEQIAEVIPAEQPKQIAAKKAAKPEPTAISGADKLKQLCSEEGISTEQLFEFLRSIDLDDGKSILKDLPAENIESILNQWDEFAAKIKEVLG